MNVGKYDVWRDFAETTSCHGVKEIVQSKNIFWKIFWSLSVLFHAAFLVYGVWSVINDYLTAPTVTKVSLISVPSLQLPDLAFCNTNGLNRTAMTLDQIPETVQWQLRDLSRVQFLPAVSKMLASRNLTLSQFLIKYSYKCEELLHEGCATVGSTVRGRCCDSAEIYIHRYFGVCYTFRGKNQTTPGISNGWRMNFKIPETPEISEKENTLSQRQAYDAFSFADGLAFEIGYKYKHLNQNPILMSKNQVVSASFRPELHLRMDESCEHSTNDTFVSSSSCSFWCRAKSYNTVCNCAIFGYSEAFYPGLRLCDFKDFPTCLHLKEVQIANETNSCIAKCKPACQDFNFKPSVTYSDLSLTPFGINLRVQLGYSDLEYSLVEEVRSYTFFMAISSLGGQAGLWMGCSILTLIHAVTYCGWAFTLCCSKKVQIVKRDSLAYIQSEIILKHRRSKEGVRV